MSETTCIHQVYNPEECPLLSSISCDKCLFNTDSTAHKKMGQEQQLIINNQMDKDYEEANKKGK